MRRQIVDAGFCRASLEENERGVSRIAFWESAGGSSKPAGLAARLKKYFDSDNVDFSAVKLDLGDATKFQRKVFAITRKIPYGETRTYGWIARKLKTSPRAVGQALKKNPVPVIIPCHRVVSSEGVGGYSGGLDLKVKLLKLEGALE